MTAKRQRSDDEEKISVRLYMGSRETSGSIMTIDTKMTLKATFLRRKAPTVYNLYALFSAKTVLCLDARGDTKQLDLSAPLNDGDVFYLRSWSKSAQDERKQFRIGYTEEYLRRLKEKQGKHKRCIAALEAQCRDVLKVIHAMDPSRPKEPDF